MTKPIHAARDNGPVDEPELRPFGMQRERPEDLMSERLALVNALRQRVQALQQADREAQRTDQRRLSHLKRPRNWWERLRAMFER
jgi:hypothetical protein